MRLVSAQGNSGCPFSLLLPGQRLRKIYVDFSTLALADPNFMLIFAPTLRIRGNAEVRPPNVKGTVMQTGISGYVGSPHRSRFSIYHNCQKATLLLGIFGIIRTSADDLRKTPHVLPKLCCLHDTLPSLHRMWLHSGRQFTLLQGGHWSV